MKCTKAQELYFLSRDDALDEISRMKLARHLECCPSCALLVKEMEASLDAVRSLPELAAPEGFEWNVKRRILQEKSKLMRRREEILPFGNRRWMSTFAAGAAVAAAIVIVAAVFTVRRIGTFEPRVREVAESAGSGGTSIKVPADDGLAADYSMPGTSAGPRMVSNNIFTIERGAENMRQSPFQFVADSREDSLSRENELLRRRVQSLERQIMLLNSMLDKERMHRLSMSLP